MQSGTSAWRAVARVLRSPADSLCCALFPTPCRLCSAPLTRLTRVPVCNSCWNQLPEQSGRLCVICGEALGVQGFGDAQTVPGDELCRPCRMATPPFAQAVAHGLYQDRLRELIHLLKYHGMEPIADRLGVLLAHQVLRFANAPKKLLVVPVPLFRTKRRQRQFNQAELLARAVINALKQMRPDLQLTMAAGLLERRRATESQAGLTPHQRRANVRGAFFVPKPDKVKDADVLLIDDIYTTGATARACALSLRRAGAKSVRVATVARAQRHGVVQPLQQGNLPMHEDVAFWNPDFVPAARGA
jgi:ComF family protein